MAGTKKKIKRAVNPSVWFNTISNKINRPMLIGLSILVSILLIKLSFKPDLDESTGLLAMGAWIIFIILSLIYTLNASILHSRMKREIRRLARSGRPVRGIRGFSEVRGKLRMALLISIVVSLSSMISFALFVMATQVDFFGDVEKPEILRALIATFALSMTFLSISLSFLVEFPSDPTLSAGSLLGYYEPDQFPIVLDNLLSSAVLQTYADPITFMKFDDWIKFIEKMLSPAFEDDEEHLTRIERAVEKILLLAYLAGSIPEVMTKEVIHRELAEIVSADNVKAVLEGKEVGLDFDEIREIVARVEKEAPEVFRIVDKLMVTVVDNYGMLRASEFFFLVSAPNRQSSVTESTGILVYLLDRSDGDQRVVQVGLETDEIKLHPSEPSIELVLDKMDAEDLPETRPELISEGEDVLSLLATLLQVGDSVWFRIQPTSFGPRVVTVSAQDEETGEFRGVNLEIKFTKNLAWYVKTFAPKLSVVAGSVLPMLQMFLLGLV